MRLGRNNTGIDWDKFDGAQDWAAAPAEQKGSAEIHSLAHVHRGVSLTAARVVGNGLGVINHVYVVGRAIRETSRTLPGIARAVGLDSVEELASRNPT